MAGVIVRCKRHGVELATARYDEAGTALVSWQEFSPTGVQLLRVVRARRASDPSWQPGDFELSLRRLAKRLETTTRSQPLSSIDQQLTPWCVDCAERLAIPAAALRARLAHSQRLHPERWEPWAVATRVGRDPDAIARAAAPHPAFDEVGRPTGRAGELLERWLYMQLVDLEEVARELHRDVEVGFANDAPADVVAEFRALVVDAIEQFNKAGEKQRAAAALIHEALKQFRASL